jgi:multidrug efflux pump subunit AcrB
MKKTNLAGRIAEYFLRSKLTPALVIALTAWGLFAVFATPRQENPQITMPAAIIVTQYPGASAHEVQRLVTDRGERVLQQVAGIEHIYAISNQNVSIMTVLFHVGDDPTKSFVDLYDHVYAHLDELPPGALQPKITPVSVDDLPIVVLTLHGSQYDRGQLNDAAERLIDAIKPISGVSTIETYGARQRQVDVTVDPVKLAAYQLSPLQIAQALGSTNIVSPVGSVRDGNTDITIHAGTPYSSVQQVAAQIVGVSSGQPVALSQVAKVTMSYTPDDDNQMLYANGPAARADAGVNQPAVTVAIAKKPGTNAVDIADNILATVSKTELPPGITTTVTRNDGEKANDAVNELIERLMEAIAIVVLLLLMLGWREAIVVATAIPLTLFVTLGTGMLTGQTINRITLFALILGLGLLVDQAIVIVENIHRHYHEDPDASKPEATVRAVAEIGSPTTLATLTVVLSFLPMLFVTGMMGPYMRPIPINVPVAMIASLFIAFAITPWATYALLRNQQSTVKHEIPRWIVPFRRTLAALLEHPWRARAFLAALAGALILSITLPVFQLVKFRMLPDANQTTFLVSIDAPPSSSVQNTTRIAKAVGRVLARTPEVANYETFVGVNAVPDLSSLLQATIFRNSSNQADIRVNLTPKNKRKIQSADLAMKLRPELQAVAARYGAALRILQTPPGPPVRDTIFAKIYGPDPEERRAIAARVVAMMQREQGVVDVDSSYKPLPLALQLEVDQRKAALSGVDAATIVQTLGMALHGAAVSTLHTADARRPIGIVVRFAPQYRRDAASLGSIMIPSRAGGLVPLSSVTNIVAGQAAQPLYQDDYRNVTYVGADMAGRSSTYAVIDFLLQLARKPLPAGYRIDWGGEWNLTLTVFADLGRAMLIAFILIYFVLVARFRSFRKPLVVLAAVPLALLGVLPGFAILAPFGVYFSATAMIGVIALIGIVVRNSIILIEFIEDKVADGLPLRAALIEATTARTRPIFLTAAAGVLSSVVIAADPVWSGLAWSLVFGMSASAVLSVLAIPLLYLGVAEAKPPRVTLESVDHPVDAFVGFDA